MISLLRLTTETLAGFAWMIALVLNAVVANEPIGSALELERKNCTVVHETFNGKPAVAKWGSIVSRVTVINSTGEPSWEWTIEDGSETVVASGSGDIATLALSEVTESAAGIYRVSFRIGAEQVAMCAYELKVVGWTNAKVGGGGFVTGGDVAEDGTKIFRTDTSGAYMYNDEIGEFESVVPCNLPTETAVPWNGTGVYEALVCESDSDTLYVAYNTGPVSGGTIFKSNDKGKSWTAVKVGMKFDSNRGKMRTMQRHGDIDPRNSNHVLMGDETAMFRTTDGGESWTLVSGLPEPSGDTPGFSGVAFNRNSPLVQGLTSEIILSTGGTYWRSLDSGESWVDISAGSPDFTPMMAEFDANGAYFCSNSGLWRFKNGSWFKMKIPNDQNTRFAIDPKNSNNILVGRGENVNFSKSTNGGATWSRANWRKTGIKSSDGISWHNRQIGDGYLSNNWLVDPVTEDIWLAGGNQGIVSISFDAAFDAVPGELMVHAHGVGIEQICPNVFAAPPGSPKLHVGLWDEGYGQLSRDNKRYPDVINDTHNFSASWGVDYSKEDPSFIARFFSWDKDDPAMSGWSDDDGNTWNTFESLPSSDGMRGVTLAYSGKNNIIVVLGNSRGGNGDRSPWYTLDRGKTWKQIDLGIPWNKENTSGILNAYYLDRQILVADPERLGTFYFYSNSTAKALAGLWMTTNGGVNWRRQYAGPPPVGNKGMWNWNAKLASPVAGHIWISAGGESPTGKPGRAAFFRSFDQGRTLTQVPGPTVEIAKFGFGAAGPSGSGYPTLFIDGYLDGIYGTWMSPNADAESPTWISLGRYSNDMPHAPRDMTGDPSTPGRVWSGLGCAGVAFGDFSSLL